MIFFSRCIFVLVRIDAGAGSGQAPTSPLLGSSGDKERSPWTTSIGGPQGSPIRRLASDIYDLRGARTSVMAGNCGHTQGQRPSQGAWSLFCPGVLERGRAAPAEGVHSDEISHEAARAKIEAALIFTIAAMFLLIPHQTAPLCCTLEALLPTPREAVCSLESSIARQNRRIKRS